MNFKPGDHIRYRKDVSQGFKHCIGLEGIFRDYANESKSILYFNVTKKPQSLNNSLSILSEVTWNSVNFELCEPRKKLLVRDLLL